MNKEQFKKEVAFDPRKSLHLMAMAITEASSEELDHLFDEALEIYRQLHEKNLDLKQSFCVVGILLNFMQISWIEYVKKVQQ